MRGFYNSKAFLFGAALSLITSYALAQSEDVETSSMTPRELFQYAEGLRTAGNGTTDLEAALALHRQLAEGGNELSYERMARILRELDRLEEAKLALELGSMAGDPSSQRNLAIWNLLGSFGEFSDPGLGIIQLEAFLEGSNDQSARYALARAYEDGTGTAARPDEAYELYRALADEGHLPSMQKLGDFMRDGAFGPADPVAAADYYQRSAEGGLASSWTALARLYLDIGEPEQASTAYEKAIEAGHGRALVEFSRGHFAGSFGSRSDPALGFEALQTLAAETNDPNIQYMLANAFEEGQGTPRDVAKAADIYEVLAQEDHSRALLKLADFARDGTLGAADPNMAAEYYRRAGESGFASAWTELASLYVDIDAPERALAAYENAMEAGHARALIEFARGHFDGSFGRLSDPEIGFQALQSAANETDDPNAQYMLANAFEDGQGTSRDVAKAAEIYKALAEGGHSRSLIKLGDFARDGTLGAPDPAAAADYYRRANEAGSASSLLALARLLRDQGDESGAIEAYQQAIALGDDRAEDQFARDHILGNFGELSNRAFGKALLEEDAESGDVQAAAMALQLWERRSRRIETLDLEGVIAFLDSEMRAGDRTATVALARAFRVLNWRLPNARERHRDVVNNFGDQLGRSYFREYLYSVYDPNRHRQSWEEAYEIIRPLDPIDFRMATAALRSTERTAFVYLLQKELTALGYMNGSASGRFDTRTLRATMAFCAESNISDLCIHGPLTHAASMAIIESLADARDN